MIDGINLFGFLMLIVSHSSVSGLCSTCLDKRCYSNGECIIGCVPGYVGKYCNKDCPSKCLNKACHLDITDGTEICTNGCTEGYCGIQCTLPCSGDCVTCDRQCGSCNVTLCPERRYGTDCSEICSPRYEKCDRENGQCIRCRRGYYGDECVRECRACFTRAESIIDPCLSGCELCQTEETCPFGFYGHLCELPCSHGCDNRKRGCNRATGECVTGCVSGYHGPSCNYTCNNFCIAGICNQHDGICTSGCISGYKSKLDTCEKHSKEGVPTVVSIIVTIFCVTAVVIFAAFIWKRRRQCRRFDERMGEHHEIVTDDCVELLPTEIQGLKKRTLDEIEFNIAGMVRVSAVDIVLNKIKSGQRWITITGNAGDGKTIFGYMVLNEFLQKNFDVFTVHKPEEFDLISKIENEMVIMFDDRFGAFHADQHLIKNWFDLIGNLLRLIGNDKLNIHVIFISRKNVVNESKMYLGQFTDKMFDPTSVVDLSRQNVTEERKKILEYHLQHEKVTVNQGLKVIVSKMSIAHGFPRCCKIYSRLRSNGYDVDITDFFKSPLTFLDQTTEFLYKGNCKELFQRMIKNDGKFDIYTVKDESVRHALLQEEKAQEGSYITVLRNGICQFAHPSVYESVLNVINKIDPLFCVQYASGSVVRQKMLILRSDKEDGNRFPCYLIVQPIPAVMKALAERFRNEVLRGEYSVFAHRHCQIREFCEVLVSCCVRKDEKEDNSKQFINSPGRDGETMLWTALRGGCLIAVQILVEASADVTIQDDRGRTPLQYLCQLKYSAADEYNCHETMTTIQGVITKGGDVNIRDQYEQTPLHYLCQIRNPVTNDNGQDLVIMATIRKSITEGRGDVNIRDKYGQTPLHYLFKSRQISMEDVQWIITEGKGDLNQCEQNKSTPLHYLCACSVLRLDTVDILIRQGKCDFNKGDEHGTTPMHHLCGNGKTDFDVVLRIVQTIRGDINKQDDNGITPLHILSKGRLSNEYILSMIKFGDKVDSFGNTPLHYLCRRRGITFDILQLQLKQMVEVDVKKRNGFGHTPLEYLHDQDNNLPWTDGIIDRSAADLVVCRFQHENKTTVVLGPAMILNVKGVNTLLQVEAFGRELTNTGRSGDRLGQFLWFYGTCSNPLSLPASLNLFTLPSYWETDSRVTWRENSRFPLLEMGVVEGWENLDEKACIFAIPGSACILVWDDCSRHVGCICIGVLKTDQECTLDQIGECMTLGTPTTGEVFTFTFGLVLDMMGKRVSFIDVERGELMGKVDMNFAKAAVPMFYISPHNDNSETRMRLVSGREITLTDRKRQLIQQALSV